jgi:hypothetical protein
MTKSENEEYSPEETAQRFDRALKKSFVMLPQHQGAAKDKKKGVARKSRARKPKSRV